MTGRAAPPGIVHVVVPDGVDDPRRPSGGNHYDRRMCDGLAALGWTVHERAVPGDWPTPDAVATRRIAGLLGRLSDGALVLVDGLVASAVPEVVAAAAARLRVVVLVHMPLGTADEAEMLTTVAGVVTTSRWTRARLSETCRLPAERVHVAPPGADLAGLTRPGPDGGRLLSVAAVTRGKGYDVLVEALAALAASGLRAWRCSCVGSLDVEPDFAADVLHHARLPATDGGVDFTGPLTGTALEARYADADLLVLASRAETYGMVVTEALAHGLPVVATDVGGVSEALGRTADGDLPGLLVPPADPAALATALRRWLDDHRLRSRLRSAAAARRLTLPDWQATARDVAAALNHCDAEVVVQ